MQLAWIEATTGVSELDVLWKTLRDEYFPRIGRPDTEVTLHHLTCSANFVRSLYTELLNNKQVVEGAVAAERDGADAVVLGCWADPLWEAREMVNIPVVGIGEAALLLATTLGHKFAVITVAPGVVPTIEIDLRLYGLEDRAIPRPVRSLDPPSDLDLLVESVTDPFRRLIPNFERIARECIADGAEVIVVGCGYYGPILSLHGYNRIEGTGVPVVDCSAAGLKLAETLADLRQSIGLSKSTALYHRAPPAKILEWVRRVHGLS
jgi:allantoin racemase